MKKLLMVCLLTFSSSGVFADIFQARREALKQAAKNKCADIEHAATTGELKNRSEENLLELICETFGRSIWLRNGCGGALDVLLNIYAADHAPEDARFAGQRPQPAITCDRDNGGC